jgi:hypothetical protein
VVHQRREIRRGRIAEALPRSRSADRRRQGELATDAGSQVQSRGAHLWPSPEAMQGKWKLPPLQATNQVGESSHVRFGSEGDIADSRGVSAQPPRADIDAASPDVGNGQIVDTLKPLDHLVVAVWLTIQGARREGLRHLEEV